MERCTSVRVGTTKVPLTPAIKAEILKNVRYYGTGFFIHSRYSLLRTPPPLTNPLQGAAEGVISRCSHVRIGQTKVPMTDEIRSEIMRHCSIYGTGKICF